MELDEKFAKLITNQAKYESKSLALNLLISRLQKKYMANQTPQEMNNCLQEMNAFFAKYASILGNDIEALKKI
ncbi:MAG: hypothetical protein GXX04_02875 [Clostridiaceae bacterium]|nr:hypothetical protein [Clostridiaceae bacterium]